ncbi:MAG: hypothetical protein DRO14_02135 [Thermoprotei archaeon]|nr:MAG: hypothetical protein DRO14_02135 [Thermoprotei archaeon]
MTLKIYFLGIGGWLSHPEFGQSGILIEEGNTRVLLDAGEGTYERLSRCCHINPCDIDFIVLTHRHGDHILGIPTLVQHAKHHERRLRIVTSGDVINAVRNLLGSVGIEHYLKYIDFIEIQEGAEVWLSGNVSIRAIKAIHPPPSYSYIIRVSNWIIAYSGDTSPNPDFINAARHADVLIHEVSGTDELKEVLSSLGHTSSADIGAVVEGVMPKYFIPVHYPLEAVYVRAIPSRVKVVLPIPCSSITID